MSENCETLDVLSLIRTLKAWREGTDLARSSARLASVRNAWHNNPTVLMVLKFGCLEETWHHLCICHGSEFHCAIC
jgi:hypothetical protein